jgi:hypothetical protein
VDLRRCCPPRCTHTNTPPQNNKGSTHLYRAPLAQLQHHEWIHFVKNAALQPLGTHHLQARGDGHGQEQVSCQAGHREVSAGSCRSGQAGVGRRGTGSAGVRSKVSRTASPQAGQQAAGSRQQAAGTEGVRSPTPFTPQNSTPPHPTLTCSMPTGGGGRPKLGMRGREYSLG